MYSLPMLTIRAARVLERVTGPTELCVVVAVPSIAVAPFAIATTSREFSKKPDVCENDARSITTNPSTFNDFC